MFYGYLNADILFDDTLTDSLKSVQQSILTKQLSERVFLPSFHKQQRFTSSVNAPTFNKHNKTLTAMTLTPATMRL